MNRITPLLRILLGLAFLTFGLNYFAPFLPTPSAVHPPEALAFLGAMVTSGLLGFVKGIEIAAGLALLANRAVPLALALLAPILVGINYFHLALDPSGSLPGLVLLAIELVLAWSYRGAFAPMLRARVTPDPVLPGTQPAPLAASARAAG